ncbi:MAG TPA: ABC transporter permease [Thermoanaerobaculia bacterium]|nr:ABC transporter permease [Thermoanaerobaculia bacterium]
MPLPARLVSLWRDLFQKARVDSEIDEEVRAYARMLEDEKVGSGMTAEQARRAASIEIGGVEQVKESVRDARLGTFLGTVVSDLRYGFRALGKNPGFAAAAITALALGIGATAAIFSVVNAVLLKPFPYQDPDRLAVILHRRINPVAPANFLDWRREATAFERMGAADNWVPNLTGGAQPESVQAVRVTSDILPMLGVRPLYGRVFLPEEEEPGKEHEVVLSHRLWQRRYAGDPKIVGQSIVLNGEPHMVVGVMPKGFDFPPFWATGTELWAPNVLAPRAANREGQSLRVFGRLKQGVPLASARAEIGTITARLEKQFPGSNRDVTVNSLTETVVGNVRPALLVLLAAVAFVLLISCANVAHMLLARAAARQREVAVRAALGASRSRMIRQFLTESLVLALFGGAGGTLLALWGTNLLVSLGPAHLPRIETVALDARVLAFTLGVSLLTGIAFGLAPALKASRRDLTESLREGDRGATEGSQRSRLRGVLIASEFALALVLLVGAGLMIRSFVALESIDPGFDPRRVLTLAVSVAGSAEAEPQNRTVFYRQALQRIGALPGVVSASAINHLPLAGDIWGWSFSIEGRPIPAPGESPDAAYRVVLPGYFATMEIPMLRGRDIAESDDLRAPGAVVINEWLAKRHWPGEDPIGKRITFDDQDKNPYWLTVVGVVKNTVRDEWAAAAQGEIYLAYLQHHRYREAPSSQYAYLTFVVRTTADPAALAPAVRRAVWSIDPSVTISQVQTMEQVVAQANARPRFYLLLLATFAGVALILAAVGIYGVISYSVSRRRHEIGLRMALGAGQRDVLRLVVRQGMRIALAGAGAGLAGALLLTRLMSTLLYGVGSNDPVTFVLVTLTLTAVALVASYIPARRATRIDPLVALRHE